MTGFTIRCSGCTYITLEYDGKFIFCSREPDNVTLVGIADYFDVSCDFLLGRTNCRKNATLHDFSLEELLNEILIRLGR